MLCGGLRTASSQGSALGSSSQRRLGRGRLAQWARTALLEKTIVSIHAERTSCESFTSGLNRGIATPFVTSNTRMMRRLHVQGDFAGGRWRGTNGGPAARFLQLHGLLPHAT